MNQPVETNTAHLQCRCGKPAVLTTGKEVYPHRADLAEKPFYICRPCGAHVGCHPGTTRPLGRLANPQLRLLRMKVHDALDPHWKALKGKTRKLGQVRRGVYQRLASGMNIPERECHVGMFDETQCTRALEVIQQWGTHG